MELEPDRLVKAQIYYYFAEVLTSGEVRANCRRIRQRCNANAIETHISGGTLGTVYGTNPMIFRCNVSAAEYGKG